jgi:hypothetical protein
MCFGGVIFHSCYFAVRLDVVRWGEQHRCVFDFFEAPVFLCDYEGFLGLVGFYEAS